MLFYVKSKGLNRQLLFSGLQVMQFVSLVAKFSNLTHTFTQLDYACMHACRECLPCTSFAAAHNIYNQKGRGVC